MTSTLSYQRRLVSSILNTIFSKLLLLDGGKVAEKQKRVAASLPPSPRLRRDFVAGMTIEKTYSITVLIDRVHVSYV